MKTVNLTLFTQKSMSISTLNIIFNYFTALFFSVQLLLPLGPKLVPHVNHIQAWLAYCFGLFLADFSTLLYGTLFGIQFSREIFEIEPSTGTATTLTTTSAKV